MRTLLQQSKIEERNDHQTVPSLRSWKSTFYVTKICLNKIPEIALKNPNDLKSNSLFM